MRRARRAGYTLLEGTIAVAVAGLVFVNIAMVMRTGSKAYESGAFATQVEAQATQTLDRIALAVLSASRDSLSPVPQAPFNSPALEYDISMGVQDGEVIWSDPERIELDPALGEVRWTRSPDLPGEQRVIWSRWVSPFLEDETDNGDDDNLNGLIDERGLSFDMDRNQVTIRLTIARRDEDGQLVQRTLEARVTCRN